MLFPRGGVALLMTTFLRLRSWPWLLALSAVLMFGLAAYLAWQTFAALRIQLVLGVALAAGALSAFAGYCRARNHAERARWIDRQLASDVALREHAERRLRDQTPLLESVLTHIGDAVVVVDRDRNIVVMNPAAARVVPYRVGARLSFESNHVEHPLSDGQTLFPALDAPLTRALAGAASDDVEMVMRATAGDLRSYSVTARPLSSDGTTFAAIVVLRDTTAMKRFTKDVLDNEQRYRVLAEASFEGVAIMSAGLIVESNANLARWLGYERGELVGMLGTSLFPSEEQARVRGLPLGDDVGYEANMLRRDGTTFPVEVRGRSAHFRNALVRITVVRDVTEKRQREAQLLANAEQLRGLSLRDELTGLYNRRGFLEIAEHQLKVALRAKTPCVVFFADLDDMKSINDQFGHDVGDHAIRATAQVLRNVFRSSDVVSRLGGDEFAIFAGECDAAGAAAASARLAHATSQLNASAANPYRLAISVGFAVFSSTDKRELATLMQAADASMYEAKRARRDSALRVRSG
jgi:diguanylate cyclase (GGDEF)-like protein/PAS domain S-box-containing protein